MDAMLWILTMALVALAGALWAAGIVEAYSSRRRRGEPSELPAPALTPDYAVQLAASPRPALLAWVDPGARRALARHRC